jgi:glycosyltransferase involved in cell wall biosynthesis
MSDRTIYRSPIPSISDNQNCPLWSVMIPTYNCAQYLSETLQRILAQDPGENVMQIEVVDDCSQDNPQRIVEAVGQGRILFYQQPKNVGHIANFTTCLRRSHGQLIHLLHGDDYVVDGFYQKMAQAFTIKPEIGAAFCRQIFINEQGETQSISELEQAESGILDNWLEKLALEQRIMTPSIVVRRDVYETLGGFDSRLICSEDWEMWVRIAANHPIWYEIEPLAAYRMHLNSNTGRHIRSGEDMRYTREAIMLFQAYLPPETAPRITRQARETYAFSALEMAKSLINKGDFMAGMVQIREALLLSSSYRVIRQLMRLILETLNRQH